jgi:tRNA 5-methylaminomethyl-2-thiouridine biosynthesis bifunctional protein
MQEPHQPGQAQLDWDATGQPRSRLFADVYFSRDHGLRETQYVFLQQNALAARFAALKPGERFVIGETGFGTGLNFLATWQLWRECAPKGAHLIYLSAEKYPLSAEDLTRAHSLWPSLRPLAEQLASAYPPVLMDEPNLGHYCLPLEDGLRLQLLFGDAAEVFEQLRPQGPFGPQILRGLQQHHVHWGGPHWGVDAWFLDGFAPAKNPSMWQEGLFTALARLSHPGTTLATFSAAALVKKGLAQAGFTWQKQPGFGRKRDMLVAQFSPHSPWQAPKRRWAASWYLADFPLKPSGRVLVVGAGLAGCHTARALAERGLEVVVLDQHRLAQGASGNPQGVLYSSLSHQAGPFADWNRLASVFAESHYQRIGAWDNCGSQCGLLELAMTEADSAHFATIAQRYRQNPQRLQAVSAAQASALAAVPIAQAALFLPRSGWLAPQMLCRTLLEHPSIRLYEHTAVTQLDFRADAWHLLGHEKLGAFAQVVLCCPDSLQQLTQSAHLPTRLMRGQITRMNAQSPLKRVLCGAGYIAPGQAGSLCTGASFHPKSRDLTPSSADDQLNLAQAAALSPAFAGLTASGNRVSLRCASPDYLPLVGPLADASAFEETFARLRSNRNASIDCPGSYWPRCYVNTGHGSRGLTYTPLCAEILADLLTGAPLPVSQAVFQQLHPARFLVRDLARARAPQRTRANQPASE